MFLTPFYEEIKINGRQYSGEITESAGAPTGIKAVNVDDKPLKSGEISLHAQVGCGSCHCCDYILLTHDERNGKQIHFIEISDLKRKTSSLRDRYNYIRNQKNKEDIICDEIIQEQILKVYGSLVTFLRLPVISKADWRKIPPGKRDMETERETICGKKAVFCFVIKDLNTREDSQAFTYLERRLSSNRLPAFVSDVRVMGEKEFIENYRRNDQLSL